ncbi:Putative KTSC domain-containing protein [Borrelia coriaceae ATCC 43381]|uniref:KTSC domain-containing protein n=1 Tax=Borrelia coriaceae ATCC 43381 TaxID=1408429 RepID=W5SVL8_9SPIR|nr:Putative KTSC domain-containing protein [Borrelia coriaceae ATCC 43381]
MEGISLNTLTISHELSKICQVDYDSAMSELSVFFKDGRAYKYFKIEPRHFNIISKLVQEKRSVGKYLTEHIFNKYDQEKL